MTISNKTAANRYSEIILPTLACNMDTTCITPVPPYSALIFDCDGTLADTLPVHFQTWTESLREFGATLTEEWFYERSGTSAIELIQLLNSTFSYELDETLLNADRQHRYQALIHNVKEIQAVADIARTHKGRVPMAVASGGTRSLVEATLEAIGLSTLFDTVVTVEDVVQGKPAPDIFLLAAKRLGVAPSDCIVYEDSDGGLEAACRAGMRMIDVRGLWQSESAIKQKTLTPPKDFPSLS